MKQYTLEDLGRQYDLELERVVEEIKKANAQVVLVQFPDGLKQFATPVIDFLREHTDAEFLIWLGSCFGACDYPVGVEGITPTIDLMIQFGHSSLMPDY